MKAQLSRPESSRSRAGWRASARGFSLLELLVVAAILIILFTLYWGPASGSKQRALQAACVRNLQKVYISMQLYSNDTGGNYPVVKGSKNSADGLTPLVPRYTSDVSTFICPGSKDSVAPGTGSLKGQKISYAYYMGRGTNSPQEALVTDAQVNGKAKTAGDLLFSADGKGVGSNHDKSGGNLLFCDGHVQGSGPKAVVDLPVKDSEVLLNP